ncbi:MAG: hypothetical protein HY962_08010 [Ignavibacteriae bacterium]|nr:hypothetical protein [Ignavibacteriota bacterium]
MKTQNKRFFPTVVACFVVAGTSALLFRVQNATPELGTFAVAAKKLLEPTADTPPCEATRTFFYQNVSREFTRVFDLIQKPTLTAIVPGYLFSSLCTTGFGGVIA